MCPDKRLRGIRKFAERLDLIRPAAIAFIAMSVTACAPEPSVAKRRLDEASARYVAIKGELDKKQAEIRRYYCPLSPAQRDAALTREYLKTRHTRGGPETSWVDLKITLERSAQRVPMTRVLVCGGRDYADRDRLDAELDCLRQERRFTLVIAADRGALQ